VRVLIADDSEMARLLLEGVVEELGHECLVAVDGAEAWDLYQRIGADVVISDWLMPGLDGLELCRRVRAQTSAPYTYFIILTVLEDKHHALQGMLAGADDYLIKPLDRDDLQLRLIAAARVTALQRRLADMQRSQRRLEGITLAGRELAHLLNNDLALAFGTLELVRERVPLPEMYRGLVAEATAHLEGAVRHVSDLQQVVRVETKETPSGLSLDIQRSLVHQPVH